MAQTDRSFTHAVILKALQDSYPTPLKPSEIAMRTGFAVQTVRQNLHLMDTVMTDLRFKIPRWRPKYQYLKDKPQ
jgi:hypothetical protein